MYLITRMSRTLSSGVKGKAPKNATHDMNKGIMSITENKENMGGNIGVQEWIEGANEKGEGLEVWTIEVNEENWDPI